MDTKATAGGNSAKPVIVHLRLPPELAAQVDALAGAEGRSRHAWCVRALAELIAAKQKAG